MVGGLFQLVARSIEDIPINYNPQITFFKKVYRRHIDFSIEDKKLRFKNKLDFGSKSKCRIRKLGDFVNSLFLDLEITSPEIRYKKLTESEVKYKLKKYGIHYNPKKITEQELENIKNTIEYSKNRFNKEHDAIYADESGVSDGIITTINELGNQYITDNNVSERDFYDLMIKSIMFYDEEHNTGYYFLDAFKYLRIVSLYPLDTHDNPLVTSEEIDDKVLNPFIARDIIYDYFKQNVFFEIPGFQFPYAINIEVYHNIYREPFHLSTSQYGTYASEHFLSGLEEYYKVSTDDFYLNSDTYKLLKFYLENNNVLLNSSDDVERVKQNILNSVFYGMFKNIQLYYVIFKSLTDRYHSIFLKNLKFDINTQGYFVNDPFNSLSLTTENDRDGKLFDNKFDNFFKLNRFLGEPQNVYYKHIETVLESVRNYHIKNNNLYVNSNLESFFRTRNLWIDSAIDISLKNYPENIFATEDGPSAINLEDSVKNFRILNFIPFSAPSNVVNFIGVVLDILTGKDSYGKIYPTIESIGFHRQNSLFRSQQITAIENIIKNALVLPHYIYLKMLDIINVYQISHGDTQSDTVLISFFLQEPLLIFKNKEYAYMEWIKHIMNDRIDVLIHEYNTSLKYGLEDSNMGIINIEYEQYGTHNLPSIYTVNFFDFNNGNILNVFDSEESDFIIFYSAYDNKVFTLWFNVDGGTQEPEPNKHKDILNSTKLEVSVSSEDSIQDIVGRINTQLGNNDEFSCEVVGIDSATVKITNNDNGICKPPFLGKIPRLYKKTIVQEGNFDTGSRTTHLTQYQFNDASYYYNTGKSHFFTIYNANGTSVPSGVGTQVVSKRQAVQIWFEIDDSVRPDTVSKLHTTDFDNTGDNIKIEILSTDGTDVIATKINNAINNNQSLFNIKSRLYAPHIIEIESEHPGFGTSGLQVGYAGPTEILKDEQDYNALYNSVSMFFTDVENYTFTEYSNNGNTFFQIGQGRTAKFNNNPLLIDAIEKGVIRINDHATSIWYYLEKNMIKHFNDLYNFNFLNKKIIEDVFGFDLSLVIYGNSIVGNRILSDPNQVGILNDFYIDEEKTYLDYYKASLTELPDGTAKISESAKLLDDYNINIEALTTQYINNRNLLNIDKVSIPDNLMFETTAKLHDFFLKAVYQNYEPNNDDPPIVNEGFEHDTDKVDFWRNNVTSVAALNFPLELDSGDLGIENAKGVMDYINDLRTIAEVFFDITNDVGSNIPAFDDNDVFSPGGIFLYDIFFNEIPYTVPEVDTTMLNEAYESFIQSKSTNERIAEYNRFMELIGPDAINPETLANDIENINKNYNRFSHQSDIYNYLLDIVSNAGFGQYYLNISFLNTKKDIFSDFKTKLQTRGEVLTTYIDKIDGNNTTKLYDDIENRFNNQNTIAPFAWVDKLGHAIIKSTYVDIGGQIIENQTGQLIDIISKTHDRIEKNNNLKIMIGDLDNLKKYDTQPKSVKLKIPLRFFFCRRYELSLPIAAMHATYIDIFMELEKLSNVLYTDKDTYYRRKPKIKSSIDAKYIFVEPEERVKIVENRHEMLIDTFDVSSSDTINYTQLDQNNQVKISPIFKGMCKEIYFTVQNSKFTDGTLSKYENIETLSNRLVISTPVLKTTSYKNFLLYGIDDNGNGNPIKKAQIVFNGKIREHFKDGEFYDSVNFHKYHRNNPHSGFNNYSFALYPDLLQPSGHGTLNKIKKVVFDLVMKNEVKDDMKNNNRSLTIRFYTHNQTILRIMSGLTGLAFYQ